MSEIDKVPAIGFSVTANVDGDRQVVFQGYFEQAEDDAVVNARIDRIMALTDRQRSKYKLPGLREEQRKLADELAQYKQDVDEAELNFNKAQATLDVQALELGKNRARIHNDGLQQHNVLGKSGSYVPKGAAAASLANLDKALEEVKDRKTTNEAEKKVHLDNVSIAINRRHARLALLEQEIADLERLFGG